SSAAPRVELVEDAAFVEVRLLGLAPATEHLVDGEQGELGKSTRVLRDRRLQQRPVSVASGDLLALRGIEEFPIRFGDLPGTALVRGPSDDGDRRPGADARSRRDGLDSAPPQLLGERKG